MLHGEHCSRTSLLDVTPSGCTSETEHLIVVLESQAEGDEVLSPVLTASPLGLKKHPLRWVLFRLWTSCFETFLQRLHCEVCEVHFTFRMSPGKVKDPFPKGFALTQRAQQNAIKHPRSAISRSEQVVGWHADALFMLLEVLCLSR